MERMHAKLGLILAVTLPLSVTLGACKSAKTTLSERILSEQRQEEERTPFEQVMPEFSVPQATVGPYAALPTFINGAKRCEVRPLAAEVEEAKRETSASPPAKEQAPFFRALERWFSPMSRATAPAESCSASETWCKVFGPTKKDEENHQLRQKIEQSRRDNRERFLDLERRLLLAHKSAEFERRSRLLQLQRLSSRDGVYLTNDDSMSLASAQRLIAAVRQNAPLRHEEIRPHELLNYFDFEAPPLLGPESFSVQASLARHPVRASDVTVGFSVRGREVTKETRRHVNLTFVLDRSRSMEGAHLSKAKQGIARTLRELSAGDIVQVVLFDAVTCPLVQNFVVGRDSERELMEIVSSVEVSDGSNLRDGLLQGYAAVNRLYQDGYENRVVLLTDEEASVDLREEELSTLSARHFDQRRVRLSAVGFGQEVSDGLLDRLTEAGRGASLFLSSEEDVERIFGREFTKMVETIATNVHFKLELPESLTLRAFYGEEASRNKESVRSVHYYSGTGQMYLANLMQTATLRPSDQIRLSILFDDPETGEGKTQELSWTAGELGVNSAGKLTETPPNLEKARMVAMFGYQLKHMARTYEEVLSEEQDPEWFLSVVTEEEQKRRALGEEAVAHCAKVQERLNGFTQALKGDAQAILVANLWKTYCARYSLPASDELSGAQQPSTWKLVRLKATGPREEGARTNEFPVEAEDL